MAWRKIITALHGVAQFALLALLVPAVHGQTVTTYSYDQLQRLTGAANAGATKRASRPTPESVQSNWAIPAFARVIVK